MEGSEELGFLVLNQLGGELAEVELRWVDPQSRYEISLSPGYEPAPASILSGDALANILLCIPEKPGSLLVRYKKVD